MELSRWLIGPTGEIYQKILTAINNSPALAKVDGFHDDGAIRWDIIMPNNWEGML